MIQAQIQAGTVEEQPLKELEQFPVQQDIKKRILRFTVKGRKAALLRAFAHSGSMNDACIKTGIAYSNHYHWKRTDDQYELDYEMALNYAMDKAEGMFYKRSVDGVRRHVGWYKGKPGGIEREYDTTAGHILLKAKRPHEYAERTSVSVDVNVKHTDAQLQAKLQRLIEANPDVRRDLGLALEQDVIEGEFVEGGAGPPNEVGASAIGPSPSSGAPSPENNSGVVADSKKPLPGADYYEGE